jgi:hypothetical protein
LFIRSKFRTRYVTGGAATWTGLVLGSDLVLSAGFVLVAGLVLVAGFVLVAGLVLVAGPVLVSGLPAAVFVPAVVLTGPPVGSAARIAPCDPHPTSSSPTPVSTATPVVPPNRFIAALPRPLRAARRGPAPDETPRRTEKLPPAPT